MENAKWLTGLSQHIEFCKFSQQTRPHMAALQSFQSESSRLQTRTAYHRITMLIEAPHFRLLFSLTICILPDKLAAREQPWQAGERCHEVAINWVRSLSEHLDGSFRASCWTPPAIGSWRRPLAKVCEAWWNHMPHVHVPQFTQLLVQVLLLLGPEQGGWASLCQDSICTL